jgi:hypothetical protein
LILTIHQVRSGTVNFFAEARYHRIFMGNDLHTDYLPVSFGFRW